MTRRLDRLTEVAVWSAPIRELSGLVYDADRSMLWAVGDSCALLWSCPWHDGTLGEWTSVDLAVVGLPADDPQLEAVAVGPDGGLWVSTEDPPVLRSLHLDGGEVRVVEEVDLRTCPGAGALVGGGSGIEGVVVLVDGRLLVAREKAPVLVALLGPAGTSGRSVEQTWSLGGDVAAAFADVSDLELTSAGIWLLSDRSAAVGLLPAAPLPPTGAEGWAAARIARLPHVAGKPEGIAVLPDGRLLVGLDRKKPRDNLVLLDAPGWT